MTYHYRTTAIWLPSNTRENDGRALQMVKSAWFQPIWKICIDELPMSVYKFMTIHTYIHDMQIILLQKRTLHHHHHRNIWWHSVIAQKIRFTNLAGSCAIYFDAGVEKSEHKNTNSNSSKRCQLDILLCMFCTSVIYILPTFKFPKWAPSGDDGCTKPP